MVKKFWKMIGWKMAANNSRWQFSFAFVSILLFFSTSNAQQTLLIKDPDQYQRFLDARQWFTEENYKLAYPVFKELEDNLTTELTGNQQLYTDELRFYKLACQLMEDNPAAETVSQNFLHSNAAPNLKSQLGYYLGSYYFRKQQYPEAIEAFNAAGVDNLNNTQVATMQFQHGYSYFTQKQFSNAKPLFNSVRQSSESPYYVDANYYYGLLAFNDKNYKDALQSFEIAKKDKKYAPLVPYYSAGINYAIGDKDKAMKLAEESIRNGNTYYKPELLQLLGHGYFEKKDYAKAKSYLEQYVAVASKVSRTDLYELAYCYYIDKQYAKAIEQFKPLAGGDDTLSQHAMYLLGDTYLKKGEKGNARNAFLFCSTNSSNDLYKQISLFNYGKLSYELGFDNDALLALKQYVAGYPKGDYQAEAKDLLVGVLANTSNYKEALELYESLQGRSENAKKQYAKIAFNRAQELLNDRNIKEAEALLAKAIAAPYNEQVAPLAHFWKGEIDFAKGNYSEAVQHFNAYIGKPIVSGEANLNNARYNLGYSLLRLEQYKEAAPVFNDIQAARFASEQQQTDVKLRLADCHYMQKDFGKAQPLYTSVASGRGFGADYALFQTGMISGAQNKPGDKIATLRSIETLYPSSQLAGAANMEIADTYMSDEKFKDALAPLNKIVSGKGNESLKPQAYLKLGLANYNLGNNNEALAAFKTLLKQYPQSQESEEAIDNVRSIYVEQGKPELYVSFMKEVGHNIDNNTADSLTYTAAELQLSDGKKAQALAAFKNYLQQYPNGMYAVEANYYAAEISRENKALKDAASFYEQVAENAPNKFAEKSLLQLSRIYYFEFKDYKNAAIWYDQLKTYSTAADTRLESLRGLVRCQYYLGDYSTATTNAQELLQQGNAGSDDKIFANLLLGKQAKEKGSCAEAISYFKAVTALSKAEFGAEAQYSIAQCQYEQDKLAEAEKAAFVVIQKSGSYEMWVVKSYMLLGDIYMKQKDYFNAKATYKSVAENATIPELKKEAEEKFAIAEKASAEQSKMGGGK